jgi:hypothetical protein
MVEGFVKRETRGMAIKTTYRTKDAQHQTDSAAEPNESSVADAPNAVLRTETSPAASADDRPPSRPAAAPAPRRRPVSPNAQDDERPHPGVVALAALAAFAFTATVASLIAILA